MCGRAVKETEIGVLGRSIQYDGRHQATIVRLLAMGCAAVAEEPLLVGVSVERQVLESADFSPRRALGDISVEVEHRVARLVAWGKVARRVFACGGEGGDELRPNLVGRVADAGPERGDDIAPPGAEPLHC